MTRFFNLLLVIFFSFFVKANALIEVDITRGNLNPLPIAVSPLSLDAKSNQELQKIFKKKKYRRRDILGCGK